MQISDRDTYVSKNSYGVAAFYGERLEFYVRAGEPVLPLRHYRFLMPPDADLASVRVSIRNARFDPVPGYWQVEIASESVDRTDTKGVKTEILSGTPTSIQKRTAGVLFPQELVASFSTGEYRSLRIVDAAVFLFRYDEVTKQLFRLTQAELKVDYGGGDKTVFSEYSVRTGDAVAHNNAADRFVNYSDVAIAHYSSSLGKTSLFGGTGYAIITTNEIVAASTQLTAFIDGKDARGFMVYLITEDQWGGGRGDSAAENIRRWLQSNYLFLELEYVLLVGNPDPTSGDVPMKNLWPRQNQFSSRDAPSDVYFADLTGNWDLDGDGYYGEYPDDFGDGGVDRNWDVIVGRIPVYGDAENLDRILSKTMKYENESSTDIAWRKNALLAMNPFDRFTPCYQLGEQIKDNLLVAEGDWDFFRIYDNNYDVVPAPEAVPCTMDNVTGIWSSGSYGLVVLCANGGIDYATDVLDVTRVDALDDRYPGFIFLTSCQNSYPESELNLGYSLLKNGAIATVGATRNSWYARSLTHFDGMATNRGMAYEYTERLVSGDLDCGHALYDTKQQLSFWLKEDWMNLVTFCLYGDPSLGLNTASEVDVPQRTLSVNIQGEGTVLILPDSNICTGSCAEVFEDSTSLRLIARPQPGYIFSHWSDSPLSGRGNSRLVMMDMDRDITAHFIAGEIEDHTNIAAIKYQSSGVETPAIDLLVQKIQAVIDEGRPVDLFVTPEYCLTRFQDINMGSPGIYFEYDEEGQQFLVADGQSRKRAVHEIKSIQSLARQHRFNIVLGTVSDSLEHYRFNSQLIINHEGKIVGIRKKVGNISPTDHCGQEIAFSTVSTFTLKSQRDKYFTIFPVIGQEFTEAPGILEMADEAQADLLVHSERTGYAGYEQMTADIYKGDFDPSKHDWEQLIWERVITNFVQLRHIIREENGYLIVSEGESGNCGVINLNDPPFAPSFLSMNDDRLYATVEFQTSVALTYSFPASGWYMVSVPGNAADMTVPVLFPDAMSGFALTYQNNTYVESTTIEIGKGYWLYFPHASQTSFEVTPLRYYERHLDESGWYMIGSVLDVIEFNQPMVTPRGSIDLPALEYDRVSEVYTGTNVIEQQKAYWVINLRECDMSTDIDPQYRQGIRKIDSPVPPPPPTVHDLLDMIEDVPRTFRLDQNYPNPFNPETVIEYAIPENGPVAVTVYNIRGEIIRELENRVKETGCHRVVWDGKNDYGDSVSSGVYLIQIRAGTFSKSIKAILVR